eukprot:322523-Pleurochrysis_carterae.AAC.4
MNGPSRNLGESGGALTGRRSARARRHTRPPHAQFACRARHGNMRVVQAATYLHQLRMPLHTILISGKARLSITIKGDESAFPAKAFVGNAHRAAVRAAMADETPWTYATQTPATRVAAPRGPNEASARSGTGSSLTPASNLPTGQHATASTADGTPTRTTAKHNSFFRSIFRREVSRCYGAQFLISDDTSIKFAA